MRTIHFIMDVIQYKLYDHTYRNVCHTVFMYDIQKLLDTIQNVQFSSS